MLTSARRLITADGPIWVNFSDRPMAVWLAINGELPAFSAVTYLPFALARRLILLSELLTIWNFSHAPTAARFAISAEFPPSSAVT